MTQPLSYFAGLIDDAYAIEDNDISMYFDWLASDADNSTAGSHANFILKLISLSVDEEQSHPITMHDLFGSDSESDSEEIDADEQGDSILFQD